MNNIDNIVNHLIKNIIDSKQTEKEKKIELFKIQKKILKSKRLNIGRLLQYVYKALRYLNRNKIQEINNKKQYELEKEMENINFYNICFGIEDEDSESEEDNQDIINLLNRIKKINLK